jgi:hypothetical protein
MTFPFFKRDRFYKYRMVLLLCMVAIVPLGYGVRFAQGGEEWLKDAFGSVAYEIFWILFVGFIYPPASPLWVAMGVFLATCGLEFLQLWQPPFLQAMRATLPGRLVLGNTFSWLDFPAYVVGSSLGWVCLRWLHRKGLGSRE